MENNYFDGIKSARQAIEKNGKEEVHAPTKELRPVEPAPDELVSKNAVLSILDGLLSEMGTENGAKSAEEAFFLAARGIKSLSGYETNEDIVARSDVHRLFKAFALRNDSTMPDSEIEEMVNALPGHKAD